MQPSGARTVRLFFRLMYVLPALAVVLGVVLVVAGIRQAPRDDAEARAFLADASCGADFTADVPHGECRTYDATVDITFVRSSGGVRGQSSTPALTLHLANGRRFDASLVGAEGRAFAQAVYPQTAARAQLFRGTLVRVSASGVTAETSFAPDAMAENDATLPWVGAAAIAVGTLFLFLASRADRRVRAGL